MRDQLRPIKQLIKQTPLWPLLRPRRFHAYGVGASKTGTTSIARMFMDKYRTGHEHHLMETVELVRGKMNGTLAKREILSRLKKRENQMRLECESNSLLAYLSEELSELFPDSKFILTIRDPCSWLSSVLRQRLSSPYSNLPQPYKEARNVRREMYNVLPYHKFPKEEKKLAGKGLWNIEASLQYWKHQNETVIQSVPEDRLIVIETSKISHSLTELAEFLDLPISAFTIEKSHRNKSSKNESIYDYVDKSYLHEKINSEIGEFVEMQKERGVMNGFNIC